LEFTSFHLGNIWEATEVTRDQGLHPLSETLRRIVIMKGDDADADARRRIVLHHIPLIVGVLMNIHQVAFIKFWYLSLVILALALFLQPQSLMYTAPIFLVR
jgi:hypothetical protein